MSESFEFFRVVGRTLMLDGQVYELIRDTPFNNALVATIVVMAGLSAAVGQSVVLFASRVRPRRFVFSLFFSACIYTFSFFFLAASIWLVGDIAFERRSDVGDILRAVGLGYSPYLFSFFTLAPYFGNPIGLLLSVWSLIAIVRGVHFALGLGGWQALLCVFLGWLLLQVLQRTVGRPMVGGVRWLRRRVAGAPIATTRAELRELFDLPQYPRSQHKSRDESRTKSSRQKGSSRT